MKHIVHMVAIFGMIAACKPVAAQEQPGAAATAAALRPWNACFVAADVGYGQNHTGLTSVNKRADFGSETDRAVLGGVGLGCDRQIGSWVLGIGSELNFGGLDGSHTIPTFPTFIYRNAVPWLVTATVRGGYAVSNDLLVYLRGGAAWTQNDITVDFTVPRTGLSESATDSRVGWTLGAGTEYRLLHRWSAFVEYNYSDFGKKTVSLIAAPHTVGTADILAITQNVQTVVVGAVYRF